LLACPGILAEYKDVIYITLVFQVGVAALKALKSEVSIPINTCISQAQQ